ncbi:MAG: hypothetical protein KAU35_09395, partial [candidate division Zixibacteria bacterium]|nr:hypothetical protein [candidate division Zixibacteria bacterium]
LRSNRVTAGFFPAVPGPATQAAAVMPTVLSTILEPMTIPLAATGCADFEQVELIRGRPQALWCNLLPV